MSTNRWVSWQRPQVSAGGVPCTPPFVQLRWRETGQWVGDVLWKPEGETWWMWWGEPTQSRYAVSLHDWPYACEGHKHEHPNEAEVAKRVAQAEANHAMVTLHVNVKR